jgi:hypothetical protein
MTQMPQYRWLVAHDLDVFRGQRAQKLTSKISRRKEPSGSDHSDLGKVQQQLASKGDRNHLPASFSNMQQNISSESRTLVICSVY